MVEWLYPILGHIGKSRTQWKPGHMYMEKTHQHRPILALRQPSPHRGQIPVVNSLIHRAKTV